MPRWSLAASACLLTAITIPAGGQVPVAKDRAAAGASSPVQAAPVDARLQGALDLLRADNAWTVRQQRELCEIPAPPFKEERRAAEYLRRMQALGLEHARIDKAGNAIAERPGTGGGPTVVVVGHLDTVFPESTDVRVREQEGRLHGPGIGDNCRGLAAILAVARALDSAGVRTLGRLVFVGNVGEEGPGNLRGVRHLYDEELAGKIDYFVAVDGAGLDLVTRAVGSKRYRVTFKGPGGHSFGAFGIPNPIHALGRAIATIGDLQVPSNPRTTFNVGVIGGGTSVNSIPFEAVADVDMRSESPEALDALERQVVQAFRAALDAENARWPGARAHEAQLSLVMDTIGIRPAGTQPDDAPIVRAALDAARTLGFTPRTSASSTDANVPLGRGLPGMSMDGGGRGSGAHSLDEWYEDGQRGWLGPQWIALTVTSLARVQ
ncbi:MAG TPA: M20/M25/M40 family metallo-hydrolase [Gemmatimonadaceae bacterium]|nr:M20/M25/M40 family metallo-hydrolase [Gemmatimonadaceae bacterium]